jgi:hypothetical protein
MANYSHLQIRRSFPGLVHDQTILALCLARPDKLMNYANGIVGDRARRSVGSLAGLRAWYLSLTADF